MGNRGNIAVDFGTGDVVFFYSHWGGSGLDDDLRRALEFGRGRYDDGSYLARIIFERMIHESQHMSETGFGISVDPAGDVEHDILVVDVPDNVVRCINKEPIRNLDSNMGQQDWHGLAQEIVKLEDYELGRCTFKEFVNGRKLGEWAEPDED
jgi:hypothetical protein